MRFPFPQFPQTILFTLSFEDIQWFKCKNNGRHHQFLSDLDTSKALLLLDNKNLPEMLFKEPRMQKDIEV